MGPAGVGKARLATALARASMCRVEPMHGCGACDSCRRVDHGQHTDVVWLRGEGKSGAIKVQAARDIIRSSQRAPYEGPVHFVIVDPAERMMDQAANALLKSFEEPRAGVHYLLLTENLGDVIETVRSRCTTLALGPLDRGDLERALDEALASQNVTIDAELRSTALDLADGRPGRALQLATDPSLPALLELLSSIIDASAGDHGLVFGGDNGELWQRWKAAVTQSHDPELAPPPPEAPAVIKKGSKAKTKGPKAKAPPAWGTPFQQRQTARRLAQLWLAHLSSQLRGREGLVKRPTRLAPPRLVRQIRIVQQLESSLKRNPNVRLALERCLLEAAS